jgi:hypothetical protein
MALNIENTSGATLDINDLGITLAIGEIVDLTVEADPVLVARSATGGDLDSLVTAPSLVVKDPIDGVTNLSVAEGRTALRAHNETHWRVGSGARIGDISDVDTTGASIGDVLTLNGSGVWEDSAPATLPANQDVWETVASDSGSAVANTTTDTLTIAGGTGITTAVVGDTLTITATGGASDELVGVSANDTTPGYLNGKLVATTDETSLTENNDGGNETLSVGIADDAILPGTGSTTVPIGTTAQRPGTPTTGMIRYNTDEACLETYNGIEWRCVGNSSTGVGNFLGSPIALHYLGDKEIDDAWLGITTRHITSNKTHYVMPFDGVIRAITFQNSKDSADPVIEIYVSPASSGNVDALAITWSPVGTRVAYRSDFSYALSAGDKVGCRLGASGGTKALDVVLSIYVELSTDTTSAEIIEDYSGTF